MIRLPSIHLVLEQHPLLYPNSFSHLLSPSLCSCVYFLPSNLNWCSRTNQENTRNTQERTGKIIFRRKDNVFAHIKSETHSKKMKSWRQFKEGKRGVQKNNRKMCRRVRMKRKRVLPLQEKRRQHWLLHFSITLTQLTPKVDPFFLLSSSHSFLWKEKNFSSQSQVFPPLHFHFPKAISSLILLSWLLCCVVFLKFISDVFLFVSLSHSQKFACHVSPWKMKWAKRKEVMKLWRGWNIEPNFHHHLSTGAIFSFLSHLLNCKAVN